MRKCSAKLVQSIELVQDSVIHHIILTNLRLGITVSEPHLTFVYLEGERDGPVEINRYLALTS